jgi:hypothetical protein
LGDLDFPFAAVDQPVVPSAEQDEIVDFRFAVVSPENDVVQCR